MENSRIKQFLSFKLQTILSSVMKPQALWLHPAWGSQPVTLSAPDIHPSAASWLDDPGSPKVDGPPDRSSERQ